MFQYVSTCTTAGLLLSLFIATLTSSNQRTHQTDDIFELLSYPRLAFHPQPEGETTLIRFEKNKPETYVKYVNATSKFLSDYLPNRWDHRSWIDCEAFDKYRPEEYYEEVCHFKLNNLGEKCFKDNFGYKHGQPCILFNLERIYDWLPVPYSNNTVPDNIQDLWSQYSITLKCGTTDAPSQDNIGPIEYYPRNGFPFKYFPFTGQSGWRHPLVFVRFARPSPAITLFVECKIYARNIKHNRKLDTGMVSFELLVD